MLGVRASKVFPLGIFSTREIFWNLGPLLLNILRWSVAIVRIFVICHVLYLTKFGNGFMPLASKYTVTYFL
jgi:hypothetical protein